MNVTCATESQQCSICTLNCSLCFTLLFIAPMRSSLPHTVSPETRDTSFSFPLAWSLTKSDVICNFLQYSVRVTSNVPVVVGGQDSRQLDTLTLHRRHYLYKDSPQSYSEPLHLTKLLHWVKSHSRTSTPTLVT